MELVVNSKPLKAMARLSMVSRGAASWATSGWLYSSSWQMGWAKRAMPTEAGMPMSSVTRKAVEEMRSTWRWSLEAMAPESTGSRLVEMGTTKAPGKSKNLRALPKVPFHQSAISWVKPAPVCRRCIKMAPSMVSSKLKKQEPMVIGTAKRTRLISVCCREVRGSSSPKPRRRSRRPWTNLHPSR